MRFRWTIKEIAIESVGQSKVPWVSLYLEPRDLTTGDIEGQVRRFRTPYLEKPSTGSGSGTT